jgi:TonB family protein
VTRKLDAHFRPRYDDIAEGGLQQLFTQLRHGLRGPPPTPPSRRDPPASGPLGALLEAADLTRAVQAPYDEPVAWLRTEVEVIVEPDGTIADARVLGKSGRAHLDALALEAARRAILARARRFSHRTHVRFVIESGAALSIPKTIPIIGLGGRVNDAGLMLFGFSFDETTGKIGGFDHPFKPHVRSRVSIDAIEAETE